jgi:hypothetical protein
MRFVLAAMIVTGCIGKPDRPGGWHQVDNAHEPGHLVSARLTWDPSRHAVVMYGGETPSSASDAMWSFDGSAWTKLCDPCGVHRARAGFTWTGTQLMIFGGEDKTSGDVYTNSTYIFDTAWHELATTGDVPDVQTYAQLVPYRDRVYAVGGYVGNGPSNLLASLGGTTWRTEATGGDVMASMGMGATYDADHDRILAAIDATGNFEEDGVWSYDGAWHLLCDPCTGVPKHGASLVHVPGYDLTLLIGGERHDATQVPGTWRLDGDRFVAYDLPEAFPARTATGVAYDPERERIVVYGGASPDCDQGCDQTWELAPE